MIFECAFKAEYTAWVFYPFIQKFFFCAERSAFTKSDEWGNRRDQMVLVKELRKVISTKKALWECRLLAISNLSFLRAS